jgi:hypothetical protein
MKRARMSAMGQRRLSRAGHIRSALRRTADVFGATADVDCGRSAIGGGPVVPGSPPHFRVVPEADSSMDKADVAVPTTTDLSGEAANRRD